MPTVLITGFGPFPGAPFNPTDKLVRRLARLRRPALVDVTLVGHVFETSYAAVDRDLPALIATHKPDALLMFGLATRAKRLRIETRARNALALLPGVDGKALRRSVIDGDKPAALVMPAPVRRLLRAAQAAQAPARLSRDAGRYLCNYLCWRAAEAAVQGSGPRLAAFVHVPPVRRFARPVKKELGPRFLRKTRFALLRGNERKMSALDLRRAGENLLVTMLCAVNRA